MVIAGCGHQNCMQVGDGKKFTSCGLNRIANYNNCVHVFSLALMAGLSSLVRRPSTPPVFDRFQYAKTEGEGLGNFIT